MRAWAHRKASELQKHARLATDLPLRACDRESRRLRRVAAGAHDAAGVCECEAASAARGRGGSTGQELRKLRTLDRGVLKASCMAEKRLGAKNEFTHCDAM